MTGNGSYRFVQYVLTCLTGCAIATTECPHGQQNERIWVNNTITVLVPFNNSIMKLL